MRVKVICCESMSAEVCRLAEQSRNTVDLEFLPKALETLDAPEIRARLQQRVDAASAAEHDAIALACGPASCDLAGIEAREIPLVVPRALLGRGHGRLRHAAVRVESSGWMERGGDSYRQLTYVETAPGETACGDSAVLQRLLDGEWSEAEFLVLGPGQKIEDGQ